MSAELNKYLVLSMYFKGFLNSISLHKNIYLGLERGVVVAAVVVVVRLIKTVANAQSTI